MWSIVIFIVSAGFVVLASSQMARYSDVIAIRTGLGRLFIGTVLLAAATSLPEIVTNVASIMQGLPELAAGDLLGSCIFNMLIIALLDILNQRAHVLRRVAMTHTLTAALGIAMLGLAVLFILARMNVGILWIGLDSIILFGVFLTGLYLIRKQGRRSGTSIETAPAEAPMSLSKAVISFVVATAILWGAAIFLVSSSKEIAEMTGVGTAFFGASAFALVTSLPELVAALTAARMGAYDLAVGNLFGSSVFNVMALALTDTFYTKGYFLSDISPAFAMVGMVALLLTSMALIGQLARVERRIWFVEVDALLIIIGYALGMYLLFTKGVSLG